MGKSFKEKPWKYKNNKDFQKKQKRNDKHNHQKPTDDFGGVPIKDWEAFQDS